MGRVSWLESNSTPLNPLWLGSWIKLEIVASTKLESCLVVFGLCTLKYQSLPKNRDWQIFAQNSNGILNTSKLYRFELVDAWLDSARLGSIFCGAGLIWLGSQF